MSPSTLLVIERITEPGSLLRRHDAHAPLVRADDRGLTRGDGVFESLTVRGNQPEGLDAHLARLQSSLAAVDLPPADPSTVHRAIRQAVSLHRSEHPDDAPLTAVLTVTRGPAGVAAPTAWVRVGPATDWSVQRRDGVHAVTLSRGMPAHAGADAPWLLHGVKTLSYAVHMAALREAARRGAEEVVFTSTDGWVLESPTASVLVEHRGRLLTPPQEHGVLAGTTVRRLLDRLRDQGADAAEQPVPAAALGECTGLWLISSGRLSVPVRELDGRALPGSLHRQPQLLAALGIRGARAD